MEQQILIKDRVKARPFDQIDEAITEAKSTTSKVTKMASGIKIKRLQNLLIIF